MMAIVVNGDALNPADIDKAFAAMDNEVDAVITSLGGTTANPEVDSQGNINLIEAAAAKGVKKFILVTSIGCGDSKAATPENIYETLAPVLVQKDKAEERLRNIGGDMQFVIIRPGGLRNEPPTGKGVLTESNKGKSHFGFGKKMIFILISEKTKLIEILCFSLVCCSFGIYYSL